MRQAALYFSCKTTKYSWWPAMKAYICLYFFWEREGLCVLSNTAATACFLLQLREQRVKNNYSFSDI